jgi:hypothetical protein
MDGNLIISADGVKRRLPDAFGICGRPECVRQLGEALIQAAAAMEASPGGCTYGWTHVNLNHPSDAPSGPPQEWAS